MFFRKRDIYPSNVCFITVIAFSSVGLLRKNYFKIGSTETWNPETETEYGIRERRFQAIDLKKIYISNDNEISKHTLKKDTNE